MSDVECFWVEPTAEGTVHLRRFVWSAVQGRGEAEPCPGPMGYHDASVDLGETWSVVRNAKGFIEATPDDAIAHDDPRWPTTCAACGFVFRDSDPWQVNVQEGWRRPDTGEVIHHGLMGIPAGAMWDAQWMPEKWRGPDGLSLTVQLPDGGAWCVDGPASNAPAGTFQTWARTGDPRAVPPTVSATPSILTPGYHGFLTAGKLVGA